MSESASRERGDEAVVSSKTAQVLSTADGAVSFAAALTKDAETAAELIEFAGERLPRQPRWSKGSHNYSISMTPDDETS